ncbi:recombinase family protein [Deinococcus ruber]|uniref:Recombinase family protein n=1 Tax=Deinococcus ruber TaxID=1848197 RepID=A0A918F7H4_9DEIO|nr:recombinase family protein [Deinococcus ruber]GGR07658.1 hypothetical protein GCM10008957_20430 [Deinococcus ruber]
MTIAGEGKRLSHQKIHADHLERLAVVYIRQSTLGQLQRHQESTRLQYALVDYAESLGWPRERIVVIDDDLGKSGSTAVGRPGFTRLVTEVTLGHVGLILGIEMSRLARSNKDWHHLLEVCALFRTLIADTDSLYNPGDYNDRLLLGLKGSMSEAELHILKSRLNAGKLNKARRGELAVRLPIGYIYAADGPIQLDPDEQAQHVVRLIFRKFGELGTLHAVLKYLVQHGITLGVRERSRADAPLSWRSPNRMTLQNIMRHPMYAGVYAYGRRQTDARKRQPGRPGTGRVVASPDAWHAFIRDHVPAYISWATYQEHLARLSANRMGAGQPGAARNGAGLLSGLLVCGQCGRRMVVQYHGKRATYACSRTLSDYGGRACFHCAGQPLDTWVVTQLLEALLPSSLALSLETLQHLEEERAERARLWQYRLERASYEMERAARQYQAVEPEHRLVARSLERAWEVALEAQRELQEEYGRVQQHAPRQLTEHEITQIQQLAHDLPALWAAPGTTLAEQKEMLRLVIERIVVHGEASSEHVRLEVHWYGGRVTQGDAIRPVARLQQLSSYDELVRTVKAGIDACQSSQEVADQLNTLGYRPPKRRATWTAMSVRKLAVGLGCHFSQGTDGRRLVTRNDLRDGDWWTIQGLAVTLGMPSVTLYSWIRQGELQVKRTVPDKTWLIWADEDELARLRLRRATPLSERIHQRWMERAEGKRIAKHRQGDLDV